MLHHWQEMRCLVQVCGEKDGLLCSCSTSLLCLPYSRMLFVVVLLAQGTSDVEVGFRGGGGGGESTELRVLT